MKVILLLLLCGLSYVQSSEFNCNQDYPKECTDPSARDFGTEYPEGADLEDYCMVAKKNIDCNLDFAIRCPNTLTGATRQVIEDYKHLLGRVCNKSDPLRQKYLEKVHCFKKELEPAEKKCEDATEEQDYCERSFGVLKCAEDEINKRCGRDGEELFTELFKNKYSMTKVFCT